KKGITGIVLEYIQTTDQSGPFHWATHDYSHTNLNYEATGKDNYYNNYFYAEGWAHFGMNNGNPLLTSPIYNTDGSLWHFNNRVKATHVGISYTLSKCFSGRILTTYSKNYGTHDIPYFNVKECLYSLAEVCYHPQYTTGWNFTISGGWDKSSITGNNRGISLKINKVGLLTK
ncbi:MAG: capsule assembly Wzi family protein, partial [Bacteroidota bacterium]|nr:capsule assembly Wzi family protein [Bacteroidota bacterium]